MFGRPEYSNPAAYRALLDDLESGTRSFQTSVDAIYSGVHSTTAVIRIAYLLMFRHFGYGYVRSKGAALVRRQILNPADDSDMRGAIVKLESAPPDPFSVHLLHSPQHLRCFLVVMNLTTHSERNLAVIMPGLSEHSEDIYSRWAQLGSSIAGVHYVSRQIPFSPSMICNADYAEWPYWLWENTN
jgi:hypothetical protein